MPCASESPPNRRIRSRRCSGERVAVVAQKLLDLRGVVFAHPTDLDQPQQVFRPGGDFQILAVGGRLDGFIGIETPLGQRGLGLFAQVVAVVAKLLDQAVDAWRRGGCAVFATRGHGNFRDERRGQDEHAHIAKHSWRVTMRVHCQMDAASSF